MAENLTAPTYTCECGADFVLEGEKIGDSVTCRTCKTPNVLIRSKIRGSLPENYGSMKFLSASERGQVQDAFANIVQRRKEKAKTGSVTLVKNRWIFLLGLLGPYMSGYLAQQNLTALVKPVLGKRLFVVSLASYFLLFTILGLTLQNMAPWFIWTSLCAYTFFMSLGVTLFQSKATVLGFENRAKAQFPLVSLLIVVALALAEGFIVQSLLTLSA